MRTLIIHHLESDWEAGYASHGTSFAELCERFAEHCRNEEYDRVILTRFEMTDLENEHHWSGLAEFITNVFDYAYGWDSDCVDEANRDDFCEGGQHSELVLLDDWMRELTGEIDLTGAFDGECIDDIETALNYLGIKYNRLNHLIV